MSYRNKERVLRFFDEVFNDRHLDRIRDFVAMNAVNNRVPSVPLGAHDDMRQICQTLIDAFPDGRITVQDIVAEGDSVVVRAIFKGTHRSAYQGISPTGKPVTMLVLDWMRLIDGSIVEYCWVDTPLKGL